MGPERPTLDLERQAQARVYSRLRRRAGLCELLLAPVYLLVWVGTGVAADVSTRASAMAPGSWAVAVLVVAAAVSLPWFLITLPLSYYTGFHLPHRFGQSTQTPAAWVTDMAKGLAVGACVGVAVLLGLFGILRAWPEAWWIVAAIAYLGFTVVLSVLAPIVLMPLFNRFRPLGEDRADLVERLIRLTAAAGRQVRGVYTFDMSRRTRSANAALVGLGRTRRIILGDTLIDEFLPQEIEAVLAHELGHHVHRDIPLGVVAAAGVMLVNLWVVDAVLAAAVASGVLSSATDPASLPYILLVLAVLGLLTAPLQNAYSRWRERRADAFSLQLTQQPHAFADAMTRLANQNLADANPPRWAIVLFGTHPPLQERIRRAEQAQATAG
jgi:STE24 endopeptidase